jgi:hypothetical protein
MRLYSVDLGKQSFVPTAVPAKAPQRKVWRKLVPIPSSTPGATDVQQTVVQIFELAATLVNSDPNYTRLGHARKRPDSGQRHVKRCMILDGIFDLFAKLRNLAIGQIAQELQRQMQVFRLHPFVVGT